MDYFIRNKYNKMPKEKYKLMSGEEIELKTLRKNEIEYIESLEECMNDCSNHDKTDYFYVHKKAFEPIIDGVSGKSLVRAFDSPFYKVVKDMVTRYWQEWMKGND
jgi:hypothetical protein